MVYFRIRTGKGLIEGLRTDQLKIPNGVRRVPALSAALVGVSAAVIIYRHRHRKGDKVEESA